MFANVKQADTTKLIYLHVNLCICSTKELQRQVKKPMMLILDFKYCKYKFILKTRFSVDTISV